MKFSVAVVAAALSISLGGCVSSMVSGGKHPDLVGQIQNGEQYTPGKIALPTPVKQLPLKFNRSDLPKELKDALDPYFQVRGDYPSILIKPNNFMPEMDDGFSGGYMAFRWDYNYGADVTMNDWEDKSDLLFEFAAKSHLVITSKTEIGASPDTTGMITKGQLIGYNNLASDILAQLEARRAEIERLANKYARWKSNK